MPTTTVTATGRRTGGEVALKVEYADGRTLTRVVTWEKINTAEKFAAWLLAQEPDRGDEEAGLRRAFAITFHVESGVDPTTGLPWSMRVLDSVTPATLPDDAAWAALTSSSLGTITLEQALAAVDGATSLAQLRAVVRALVQVVIPMRDVVDRLLTLLRRAGLR